LAITSVSVSVEKVQPSAWSRRFRQEVLDDAVVDDRDPPARIGDRVGVALGRLAVGRQRVWATP